MAYNQRSFTGTLYRDDDDSEVDLARFVDRFENTFGDFEELLTESKTNIIELNSVRKLSLLRDGPYDNSTDTIGHTSGDGAITDTESEYQLQHPGGGTGGEAFLRSGSRGRYQPGNAAEAGIGVRLSTENFGGDLDAKWGYFSVSSGVSIQNGLIFGHDSGGTYVQRWRNGSAEDVDPSNNTSTKVYEADWSERPNFLSNNGLSVTDGLIYQVHYTYYGYGEIEFRIVTSAVHGYQQSYVVHKYTPSEETSIRNTNLNVGAFIESGSSTTNADLFIGGRKYAIIGQFTPRTRVTSDIVTGQTIGTSLVPIMSFRRKSAAKEANFEALGFNSITDLDLEVQFRAGSSLTGASFGSISDTPDSETNLEVDTSATAVDTTTGTLIERFLVDASGSGSNKSGVAGVDNILSDIPDGLAVNFCARNLETGDATVDFIGKIKEEF